MLVFSVCAVSNSAFTMSDANLDHSLVEQFKEAFSSYAAVVERIKSSHLNLGEIVDIEYHGLRATIDRVIDSHIALARNNATYRKEGYRPLFGLLEFTQSLFDRRLAYLAEQSSTDQTVCSGTDSTSENKFSSSVSEADSERDEFAEEAPEVISARVGRDAQHVPLAAEKQQGASMETRQGVAAVEPEASVRQKDVVTSLQPAASAVQPAIQPPAVQAPIATWQATRTAVSQAAAPAIESVSRSVTKASGRNVPGAQQAVNPMVDNPTARQFTSGSAASDDEMSDCLSAVTTLSASLGTRVGTIEDQVRDWSTPTSVSPVMPEVSVLQAAEMHTTSPTASPANESDRDQSVWSEESSEEVNDGIFNGVYSCDASDEDSVEDDPGAFAEVKLIDSVFEHKAQRTYQLFRRWCTSG